MNVIDTMNMTDHRHHVYHTHHGHHSSDSCPDATTTWEAELEAPTALLETSDDVVPRIMVEYATAIYGDGLSQPADLLEVSDKVEPRIVVEYATAVYHSGLEEPDTLLEASEEVRPRIEVVYATAVFKADLIYPFESIPGDFSRNGVMDIGDVVKILKMIASDKSQTLYKEADLTGDNRICLKDALTILQGISR